MDKIPVAQSAPVRAQIFLSPDLHLIHTDLKPENILLVHNDYRLAVVPMPGKVSPCRILSTQIKYGAISIRSEMLHHGRNDYFNPQIFAS